MSYNKNQWIDRGGYRKEGGRIYFPVEGKSILEGSKHNCILLEPGNREKIIFRGPFEIEVAGARTKYVDISDDFLDFVDQTILGAEIRVAFTDQVGSLRVEINSSPTIAIVADGKEMKGGWEKWQYENKKGSSMIG